MLRQLTLDNVQHAGRNELVNYLKEGGSHRTQYDVLRHSDLMYYAIERLRAEEKGRDPRRMSQRAQADDDNARIQYDRMRDATRTTTRARREVVRGGVSSVRNQLGM